MIRFLKMTKKDDLIILRQQKRLSQVVHHHSLSQVESHNIYPLGESHNCLTIVRKSLPHMFVADGLQCTVRKYPDHFWQKRSVHETFHHVDHPHDKTKYTINHQ